MGDLEHLAVHLAAGGLVEADLPTARTLIVADGFKKMKRSDGDDLSRVDRLLETGSHVRLGGQVVHLVGLDLADDAPQAGRFEQVAVV